MPVSQRTHSNGREDGSRTRRSTGAGAADVTREALRQLAELTGRVADTVSAVEHTDDGWRVEVELVELERVPSTTNILATYEVEMDDSCSLVGYRRLRRYYRNAAEEG
ncbi:MAG TPA: gas vesicle protein GvpO [Mycobacteriales bacterium]|nr:gas vesicle protein GvpO [Mycobacteriales bacterium]